MKGFHDRWLKIEIYHYDDAPLSDGQVKAWAVPRYLMLEAQSDKPAYLYYGARDVDAPQYGLQERLASNANLRAALRNDPLLLCRQTLLKHARLACASGKTIAQAVWKV